MYDLSMHIKKDCEGALMVKLIFVLPFPCDISSPIYRTTTICCNLTWLHGVIMLSFTYAQWNICRMHYIQVPYCREHRDGFTGDCVLEEMIWKTRKYAKRRSRHNCHVKNKPLFTRCLCGNQLNCAHWAVELWFVNPMIHTSVYFVYATAQNK